MANRRDGDHITVGDISHAQGIAVGCGAHAQVTGSTIAGGARAIDPETLRATLKELRTALGQADLPDDTLIDVQTAAGNALRQGVKDGEVQPDALMYHVKEIGETLKQANVAVQEGSTLWESIQKLAPLLGPLVGGARAVGAWFGVAL
jgi:hypothetical protein